MNIFLLVKDDEEFENFSLDKMRAACKKKKKKKCGFMSDDKFRGTNWFNACKSNGSLVRKRFNYKQTSDRIGLMQMLASSDGIH